MWHSTSGSGFARDVAIACSSRLLGPMRAALGITSSSLLAMGRCLGRRLFHCNEKRLPDAHHAPRSLSTHPQEPGSDSQVLVSGTNARGFGLCLLSARSAAMRYLRRRVGLGNSLVVSDALASWPPEPAIRSGAGRQQRRPARTQHPSAFGRLKGTSPSYAPHRWVRYCHATAGEDTTRRAATGQDRWRAAPCSPVPRHGQAAP
jgi:hypothetical protein